MTDDVSAQASERARAWLRAHCDCVREPDEWVAADPDEAIRNFDNGVGFCSSQDVCHSADDLEAALERAQAERDGKQQVIDAFTSGDFHSTTEQRLERSLRGRDAELTALRAKAGRYDETVRRLRVGVESTNLQESQIAALMLLSLGEPAYPLTTPATEATSSP